MAAIPVTITGVLADKYGRTLQNVTLFGEMVRSDVGVGGGPIVPPAGSGEHPSHPIALPGDPWWGGDLKPTHPIVIPEPPPTEPPPDGATKPPPPGGGWGFHPEYGWGYFPGSGGLPSPKTT